MLNQYIVLESLSPLLESIPSPDLGGHGWVFPVTFPCAPGLPDLLPDPTPINQVEGDPR